MVASVYYAVRKVIPATWINDRDQFLYPNNKWEKDIEFQHDCLAYTLFNNTIKSEYGENNWIPFREQDIEACEKFSSRFMADFLAGKAILEDESLFKKTKKKKAKALEFSEEAKEVFEAGKSVWIYYHSSVQNNLKWGKTANANASLYDIREYFQGRNPKTKRMNNRSDDQTYTKLINDLREKLKDLAKKIESKVYEYGFLKK